MKSLQMVTLFAGIAVASLAQSQVQNVPGATQDTPQPSTSQTEGTAADRTPPGATPTKEVAPGTVDPVPATSRVEGTAADRSPPGETPVRGAGADQASPEVTANQPHTQMSPETRMAAAQSDLIHSQLASKLIGTSVQTPDGKLIGEIKDLVMGADGSATHVIVSHGGTAGSLGRLAAIPWSASQAMMQSGRLSIEPSRLSQAPALDAKQWPDLSAQRWSSAADRYWSAR